MLIVARAQTAPGKNGSQGGRGHRPFPGAMNRGSARAARCRQRADCHRQRSVPPASMPAGGSLRGPQAGIIPPGAGPSTWIVLVRALSRREVPTGRWLSVSVRRRIGEVRRTGQARFSDDSFKLEVFSVQSLRAGSAWDMSLAERGTGQGGRRESGRAKLRLSRFRKRDARGDEAPAEPNFYEPANTARGLFCRNHLAHVINSACLSIGLVA